MEPSWFRRVNGAFLRLEESLDGCVRYAGALLVLLCVLLNAFVVLTYATLVLPILQQRIGDVATALHVALVAFIVSQMAFNYGASLYIGAGEAPRLRPQGRDALAQDLDAYVWIKCSKAQCGRFRDERTHHCSVCDTCFRRMDHHCAWLNVCVGRNNQRYFILYLLYTLLGVLLGVATLSPIVAAGGTARGSATPSTSEDMMSARLPPDDLRNLSTRTQKTFIFILALCSVVSVLMGALLCWTLYLVVHESSTIDMKREWSHRRHTSNGINGHSPNSSSFSVSSSCSDLCWWMPGSVRNPHYHSVPSSHDSTIERALFSVFGPSTSLLNFWMPSLAPLPDYYDLAPPGIAADGAVRHHLEHDI
ncbi:putative palmitoyltransferase ZDHHC16 [Porphyridium purpureum]|uniref:Palmitoyltransferase n=1 Tax=Porphyridium purpureum TaxID=35688 RepID=A0A5J4Z5M7_PORPP|nr:putative palmitoyltransferase ZDHHC16 [Porphyridium purpureum]|eukprot:POR5054..scf295_1